MFSRSQLFQNQTLFFSMTFANSPVQTKQWCGVMSRKQSPLFREDALGSTSRVWTWRRPGKYVPNHQQQRICVIVQMTVDLGNAFTSVPQLPLNYLYLFCPWLSKSEVRASDPQNDLNTEEGLSPSWSRQKCKCTEQPTFCFFYADIK